ncbi:gp436 family protein [Propionivibrio dicarboxylicus]|uniref:Mu-like prophage protein gp36 n=1 Tax=Propionivibrio dicarboxylicus TaxID=83767 RepID=A0A1G8LDN0_9RHOO|nr:DUF1320 domain-containing protein [Propionivibrio dicarboxylicus]SDI53746.1 Mu-like prophage protein gp36 [Propionivibrio dicarboxylicus]
MAYATQADMETRFGEEELAQLTDRESATTIDAGVVARALNDAKAEIDGYLSARYALPLTTVPDILVRINCDIARYFLFDDRVTEAVRNRYLDAVKLMRSIASGDVTMAGASALAQTTGQKEAIFVPSSRPKVFGGERS